MKEVYDNATGTTSYVYENSADGSGQVDSTVYASSAPALSGLQGYEADTEFNATSNVKIAADGSSILVVHYKLIRYTLVFAHRTAYLDGYGTYTLNNGTLTHDGVNYTTTQYQAVDVVIGQNIASLWPTNVSTVTRRQRSMSSRRRTFPAP